MRLFFASLLFVASLNGAQAQEKLTVLLDWFVNPDHAPLILADELGLFEREGLDVELVAPADPSAPPRLVAAGQGDIAISYQPNLHLQIKEGLPVTWIGTLVETPLNSLVVLKDGPVQQIADLKGRKVGFSVGGFEDAILGKMLEGAGLSLDDVELINVNFSLSPSIISGQVAGVIGAFRNFELNQMDIVESPGKAFYPEEHGVPVYDELIYIAHMDKADDPRFLAFMRAVEAATIYLTNHPDEGLDLFIQAHPDLDDELNRRAWYDTLPRFAKRPTAFDRGRYKRFAAFMLERGLIEEIPTMDRVAQPLE